MRSMTSMIYDLKMCLKISIKWQALIKSPPPPLRKHFLLWMLLTYFLNQNFLNCYVSAVICVENVNGHVIFSNYNFSLVVMLLVDIVSSSLAVPQSQIMSCERTTSSLESTFWNWISNVLIVFVYLGKICQKITQNPCHLCVRNFVNTTKNLRWILQSFEKILIRPKMKKMKRKVMLIIYYLSSSNQHSQPHDWNCQVFWIIPSWCLLGHWGKGNRNEKAKCKKVNE